MKEKLKNYIENMSGQNVEDDQPLISSRLLDSVAVLRLMLFLEKECQVDTTDPDFDVEMLDTVNDIMELIESTS